MECKFCGSNRVVKAGKANSKQLYQCKECKHRFTDNNTFVKMRTADRMIIVALDLYFEGLSVRKVARQLQKIFGEKVSHIAIWKWIMKYSTLVKTYTDTLQAKNLSGEWQVDETVIKCTGQIKWFWEVIDEKTKLLVASQLTTYRDSKEATAIFEKARLKSTTKPKFIKTDGLESYERGFKRVFQSRRNGNDIALIQNVGIQGTITNCYVERAHGTVKDRTKPMRGVGRIPTAKRLMYGWDVHYNYVRPHQSLDGQTPSDASGVDLKIEDGWGDLIALATYHQTKGIEEEPFLSEFRNQK